MNKKSTLLVAVLGLVLLNGLAPTMAFAHGDLDAADIANTLAGGVAIGSTCDQVSLPVAFAIGAVAGFASTFGFAVIQEKLQKGLRLVDICGVSNLHGIPGLLGGLAALVFVVGIGMKRNLGGLPCAVANGRPLCRRSSRRK